MHAQARTQALSGAEAQARQGIWLLSGAAAAVMRSPRRAAVLSTLLPLGNAHAQGLDPASPDLPTVEATQARILSILARTAAVGAGGACGGARRGAGAGWGGAGGPNRVGGLAGGAGRWCLLWERREGRVVSFLALHHDGTPAGHWITIVKAGLKVR